MSHERLHELKRQRALVQDHLAWLDREIAGEGNHPSEITGHVNDSATASKITAPVAPATAKSSASIETTSLALPPEAQVLVTEYEKRSADIHSDVKRGCMIYVIAAFGLIGVGILALYLYSRFK